MGHQTKVTTWLSKPKAKSRLLHTQFNTCWHMLYISLQDKQVSWRVAYVLVCYSIQISGSHNQQEKWGEQDRGPGWLCTSWANPDGVDIPTHAVEASRSCHCTKRFFSQAQVYQVFLKLKAPSPSLPPSSRLSSHSSIPPAFPPSLLTHQGGPLALPLGWFRTLRATFPPSSVALTSVACGSVSFSTDLSALSSSF